MIFVRCIVYAIESLELCWSESVTISILNREMKYEYKFSPRQAVISLSRS